MWTLVAKALRWGCRLLNSSVIWIMMLTTKKAGRIIQDFETLWLRPHPWSNSSSSLDLDSSTMIRLPCTWLTLDHSSQLAGPADSCRFCKVFRFVDSKYSEETIYCCSVSLKLRRITTSNNPLIFGGINELETVIGLEVQLNKLKNFLTNLCPLWERTKC